MTLKTQTAWAMSKGARQVQEDVLHYGFDASGENGYIIIADGMGGHTSGDIAATLAVEAVDTTLRTPEQNQPDQLKTAVDRANKTLANYIARNPQTMGMGTTLVAVVISKGEIFWASVGDSPFYLIRDEKILRLNEDHSMAIQIDQMAMAGQISQKAAAEHPHRAALTSVIMGGDIARVDLRTTPFEIRKGDVLITATDGIHSLKIQQLLKIALSAPRTADKICASITEAIDAQENPNQDNLAICVSLIL
ncbi:hypothetical protein GCM10008927_24960 [Amylibacter ulvae]|uniref:PPM-type phosphatase domain-containing protein n=1 Tax=Paramylibacter ulvae TaxID=1651968 RepID=A0ABQ3D7B1_9RHOB|nr:protein phosphatase 2C domain-containing protein [Amylibacter ulvae]GHA58364.1 hypothetical protein GCM10008927_24960 [Amylibacter ulvae]